MLEISNLTKETTYLVMRELLYTLNWLHIQLTLLLSTKYPQEMSSKELHTIHETVGSHEAKRLSRVLNISGEGVDALMQLARYSHWAVFENIEVTKLTERSFRMRIIECSTQKSWGRQGLGRYDCGSPSLLARSGFFKATNPKAKVSKIFTRPEDRPDGTPENVSCEWQISIEE